MSVPNAGGTPAAEPVSQPQQGTGTSDPNVPTTIQTPQTPAAPATNNTPPAPAAESAVANPEAKKYADEAAKYRNDLKAANARLAELEAAQKAAEEAKLSKEQLLEKRLAEYQTREAQATIAAQERILRAEVRAEAIKAGINPQLAARIIDFAAIESDDNGDPKNIGELLTKAATEYGITMPGAGQSSSQAQAAAATSIGSPSGAIGGTNPPRVNG